MSKKIHDGSETCESPEGVSGNITAQNHRGKQNPQGSVKAKTGTRPGKPVKYRPGGVVLAYHHIKQIMHAETGEAVKENQKKRGEGIPCAYKPFICPVKPFYALTR